MIQLSIHYTINYINKFKVKLGDYINLITKNIYYK